METHTETDRQTDKQTGLTHKVRAKVANGGSFHTHQLLQGKERILLREHFNFTLDLIIHFVPSTESGLDHIFESLVYHGCESFAHGQYICGVMVLGALLYLDVSLDDAV